MPKPLYEQFRTMRITYLMSHNKREKRESLSLFIHMLKWSLTLGVIDEDSAKEIQKSTLPLVETDKWNFALDAYI